MDTDRLNFAALTIMSQLGRTDESARRVITRVISDVLNEQYFADTNTAHGFDRDFPPPNRSYVKLPFFSEDEDADPLGRCMVRAAQRAGVSHFVAARAMTGFFEALSLEVESGRVVRIPGVAAIGTAKNICRPMRSGVMFRLWLSVLAKDARRILDVPDTTTKPFGIGISFQLVFKQGHVLLKSQHDEDLYSSGTIQKGRRQSLSRSEGILMQET